MSDIPYPHKALLFRTEDASGGGSADDLDDWGNPRLNPEDSQPILDDNGDPLIIPCWVQSIDETELGFSERSDTSATHTIFCEVREYLPGDYLQTLAGGGQRAGDEFRILKADDPDGGTDHLELQALSVTRATL